MNNEWFDSEGLTDQFWFHPATNSSSKNEKIVRFLGRADVAKNDGYVAGYKEKGTYDKSHD